MSRISMRGDDGLRAESWQTAVCDVSFCEQIVIVDLECCCKCMIALVVIKRQKRRRRFAVFNCDL